MPRALTAISHGLLTPPGWQSRLRPTALILVACVAGAMTAETVHLYGAAALFLPIALVAGTWITLDSRAAFVALVLLITVAGSELYVGPVRLVDAVAILAVVGAASDLQAWEGLRRPRVPQSLTVALIGLGAMVALARGTPFSLSHTDLHDGLLSIAIYVTVVRALQRMGAEAVVTILLGAAVLASVKAITLEVLPGASALGATSVLQTNVIQTVFGTKRVVLIGGDTIIALAPALCIAARRLPALRSGLWIGAFVITAVGIAVTVTRTNIIAAAATVLVAVALEGLDTRGTTEFRRLSAGCAVALLALVAVSFTGNGNGRDIIQGAAVQLTSPADIAYSLQYRSNEAARLTATLRGHELVGLGAGATYVTTIPATAGGSTFTTYGASLWAHNGYLWILLKAGIVGLALLATALIHVALQLLKSRRALLPRAGFVSIVGVLVLSYTTNRFDDPGGALLLALGFGALGVPLSEGGAPRAAPRRASC